MDFSVTDPAGSVPARTKIDKNGSEVRELAKMTYSIEDRIARITLDDGKVNAMNWEFFTELNESLGHAQAE